MAEGAVVRRVAFGRAVCVVLGGWETYERVAKDGEVRGYEMRAVESVRGKSRAAIAGVDDVNVESKV